MADDLQAIDVQAITERQQQGWATGNFHRIGVGQVIVGETLVHSLRVHAGERVLDVAGGAGNAALAAARRWADVTCTDYVPELLEIAAARACSEGLPMTTQPADAQQLPFPDGSFDIVISTFGAMFAPDQHRTAAELLRVLKPGGRLGMANWTPHGWVGSHFGLTARFAPPVPGVLPPATWGVPEHLDGLLGDRVLSVHTSEQDVVFTHTSTRHLFELFRDWFGPTARLWATLDEAGRGAFAEEWISLADRFNVAEDGTCEIPSSYLEVVAVKA